MSVFAIARNRALAVSLAAAWLLSGCNAAMRLAYENADTFLHWRALSYVPLSGKAADELDERIDGFLAWHRAKALPQYARLAADAARRINERRFADDNRKFARENRGSEKDRRIRRTRRTEDALEDWVGKLSKAQVERVKQYAERAPLSDELRERDRKRVQADVLAIIRAREAQKRLPAYLENWDRGRDVAMLAANKAWRAELDKLLLDLDRTLTAEQRAKAVARLRGFSEDFSALAVAAAGPVPPRQ